MKIKIIFQTGGLAAPKRSEGGSISLIFIVLLTIMMILVMAESRALFNLHREVKFLEQQQVKRLNNPPVIAATSPTK
jgi:hypothetical protein